MNAHPKEAERNGEKVLLMIRRHKSEQSDTISQDLTLSILFHDVFVQADCLTLGVAGEREDPRSDFTVSFRGEIGLLASLLCWALWWAPWLFHPPFLAALWEG